MYEEEKKEGEQSLIAPLCKYQALLDYFFFLAAFFAFLAAFLAGFFAIAFNVLSENFVKR
ncbi:MAG: hypothetical protein ACOYXA_09670 [Bacteroidota bacterium]